MQGLSEILQRIPGIDPTSRPVALRGGLSNRSWRVVIDGRPHVLRLGDSDAPWPANRSMELAIHCEAELAGIAPAIRYSDTAAGILVTEEVAGRALCPADFTESGVIKQVARLLARVHRLPRAGARLDIAGVARHYLSRVNAEFREQAGEVLSSLDAHLAGLSGPRLRLCHNDPVAENFVLGETLMLLDWEYAADNDPMFDLAAVSAHHDLDEHARLELLRGYGFDPDAASIRRTLVWEAVYRCIYWLWLAAGKTTPGTGHSLGNLLTKIRRAEA